MVNLMSDILRGVWRVDAGAGSISCSDFETDVVLTISGDFSGWDQQYAYAQALCDRLNKDESND